MDDDEDDGTTTTTTTTTTTDHTTDDDNALKQIKVIETGTKTTQNLRTARQ
jgi:hypothetical protein